MTATIYGLVDPRNGELRYVGKTSQDLAARLASHISERKLRYRRSRWVTSLHKSGMRPEIFEIETVPLSEWQAAEQFWIAYFLALGCRLTNGTEGGDGNTGGRHTDDTKARISASKRGVPLVFDDPAGRARKISESRKGYVVPDGTRRKMSAAKLGVRLTPRDIQIQTVLLHQLGVKRIHIAAALGIDRHTVGKIIADNATHKNLDISQTPKIVL